MPSEQVRPLTAGSPDPASLGDGEDKKPAESDVNVSDERTCTLDFVVGDRVVVTSGEGAGLVGTVKTMDALGQVCVAPDSAVTDGLTFTRPASLLALAPSSTEGVLTQAEADEAGLGAPLTSAADSSSPSGSQGPTKKAKKLSVM